MVWGVWQGLGFIYRKFRKRIRAVSGSLSIFWYARQRNASCRLVVDTGLHSKGWTREQAIAYSLANEAESEASIIPEIERYMAIPGQALSYKIGQLKILELRKKAEAKMGKSFDIKKFHEKVLESGVMPLALLEKKINAWIEGK